MRVLHLVSAPTMTGPADPALGLARGQRAIGVDAAIAYDTHRSGNMADKVLAAGVPHVADLVLSTKAGLAAAWRDRRRLIDHARSFDVVHAHTSHDHMLAAGVARHTLLVRSIHHPRGCARRGLEPWVYGRTHGFILVAQAHRHRLATSYPKLAAEQMTVVPGAVDTARFSPEREGFAVRREMGFEPDRLVLGLVARIKAGRGHRLFLEAIQAARAKVPQLAVALIGKGEGVPEVRKDVAELGLEPHVAWLGFRDQDLPEAIRACDLTVLMEEGNDASCRAVLESMACEVPVVGASHPAIVDAISPGTGLVFAARQRDALVQAIVEAASLTGSERLSMGRQARAVVLQEHTDRVRAERVFSAYRAWGARP